MKKILLNIGAGSSRIVPPFYDGWDQHVLDIDPQVKPDIVGDAKKLNIQDMYDAVYISHTLEHFYKHEVPIVLSNAYNALKNNGRIEICSPDIKDLIMKFSKTSLDINDVYYRTSTGHPVTYHDVIYGWDVAMSSGNLFYAHKCGLTPFSLYSFLANSKFKDIQIGSDSSNVMAIAYKR